MLVVVEQIEAGTAGRKQYGVALLGKVVAGLHGAFHRINAFVRYVHIAEELDEFVVVLAHKHKRFHFARHQILDFVVVIAFVGSSRPSSFAVAGFPTWLPWPWALPAPSASTACCSAVTRI